MLDDCRGERFEEILAAFSTAVLRKCLIPGHPQTPAIDYATAQQLTVLEQRNLLSLVIAYRSALRNVINERKSLTAFYGNFSCHLHGKADELATRSTAGQHSAHDADRLGRIRLNITSAWYGDKEWAQAILDGGSKVESDPLLELDFSRLRTLARKNALESLQSQRSVDLFADLDNRIAQQKSRLQKWRDFSQSLAEDKVQAKSAEPKCQNRTLLFRSHQTLTVASLAQLGRSAQKGCTLVPEYRSLLADFAESLARVGGSKTQKWRRTLLDPVPSGVLAGVDRGSEYSVTSSENASVPVPTNSYEEREYRPSPTSAERDSLPHRTRPLRDSSATIRPTSMVSISVLERAANRQHSTEHLPDPERPSSPDLIERTRQSMSFLPAREARSRQSLAPPKRSRHSHSFSVNQFETPGKTRQIDCQRTGATTPKDELFGEDAEYASVFKSRPKIATSPVNSPAVHVPTLLYTAQDGVVDLDLDDGDSYLDLAAEGSPSVGRKAMYM